MTAVRPIEPRPSETSLTLRLDQADLERLLTALDRHSGMTTSEVSSAALRTLADDLARLSARELTVLRALASGRNNCEIAADLYLSVATVKSHVARILAKVGLRDRTQAVVFAYESGLVRAGWHARSAHAHAVPSRGIAQA